MGMPQGKAAKEYLASKRLYLLKLVKNNGFKRALKGDKVKLNLVLPHPWKGGPNRLLTLVKNCF